MADQFSQSGNAPTLDTLEHIATYLAAAFEAGDPEALTTALGHVARADGLAELAAAAGLPRDELARALGSGELNLDAVLSIMKVIDLHRSEDGNIN